MVVRKTAKPKAKPIRTKSVAEYLAGASPDKRTALNKVRKAIKAAAPQAVESISYGIVGYKHNHKPVLYLGYGKAHCALYGSFGAYADDLKSYDLRKGTLRFSADKPITDRLVAKIVKARVAEIDRTG